MAESVVKTSIYLPQDLYEAIGAKAKAQNVRDNAIMIESIRKGIASPPDSKMVGTGNEVVKVGKKDPSKADQELVDGLLKWWHSPEKDYVEEATKVTIASELGLSQYLRPHLRAWVEKRKKKSS